MTLLMLSEKKWDQARLFFDKNKLAKKYNIDNQKDGFINCAEKGIFALSKDFFGEFSIDFIDLYVSELGENYVYIPYQNTEAQLTFEQAMAEHNINLTKTYLDNIPVMKLNFPQDFNMKIQVSKITKTLSDFYKNRLDQKLLGKVLFTDEYNEQERQNLYRGLIALSTPIQMLKNIQLLLPTQISSKNIQFGLLEIRRLLVKMILLDRDKNTMNSLTKFLKKHTDDTIKPQNSVECLTIYRDIINQLSLLLKETPEKLNEFKEGLELAAFQASAYFDKKNKVIESLDQIEQGANINLDKIIRFDLSEALDSDIIEAHAENFAYALKNKACHNYLNILTEDFYGLAWSKSRGYTVKKVINDFNILSNSVSKDIVNACSFFHQKNMMIFYTKALSKLLELGDFNSAQAVYAGLSHIVVSRLGYLRALPEVKENLEEADRIFSLINSMKNYHEAVRLAKNKQISIIPCLGVHLKELTFAEEGNSTLLENAALNTEKISLYGEMYTHIDDELSKLYIIKPLQSYLDLKKLNQVDFDEDKAYEKSLQNSPKKKPDLSKCKTVEDLLNCILIKRSLPLYLSITLHKNQYIMPKVYVKLIDFLDEKLIKKDMTNEERQNAILISNKIKLHASRNFMLTPEISKRLERINMMSVEKANIIPSPEFVGLDLGYNFVKRFKK